MGLQHRREVRGTAEAPTKSEESWDNIPTCVPYTVLLNLNQVQQIVTGCFIQFETQC